MPLWEYKAISSGPLGFGSMKLLEEHLNQLGKEEWEIIYYQPAPNNPLVFTGLARRATVRDWFPEGQPAPARPAAPEPLPKEKPAPEAAEDDRPAAHPVLQEEELRPLREAIAAAERELSDEADEDDLPTLFEAIRPFLRKNQKGPGASVGVDFLAKKFEQTEADLLAALEECGFTVPATPGDQPDCLEYDGDLYWLNRNNRGQLWLNTQSKPRARFKVVAAPKAELTEDERPVFTPAPAEKAVRAETAERPPAAPAELAAGPALLDQIRPMMRRNRHGGGLSGSLGYLSRALRAEPVALVAAFNALGLAVPADAGGKPAFVEIGAHLYWLNQDKSGQTWINAREQREGARGAASTSEDAAETAPPAPAGKSAAAPEPALQPASPLAAARLLLKATKTGAVAGKLDRLADELGRPAEELLAALTGAGLKVPEKAREKPVFVEHAGEIYWLNRNAKNELWLNAKASKFPAKDAGEAGASEAAVKPARRGGGRTRRKTEAEPPSEDR